MSVLNYRTQFCLFIHNYMPSTLLFKHDIEDSSKEIYVVVIEDILTMVFELILVQYIYSLILVRYHDGLIRRYNFQSRISMMFKS